MSIKRVVALLVPAWALCAAVLAADEPLKVEKEDGHVSPVPAEITFADKTKRKVMVYGVGGTTTYHQHVLRAREKGADVRVWLDTISTLTAPGEKEAVIVLKDGTERRLNHDNQVLHYVNADDSREHIFLTNLKEVKFLKPARKDSSGNAMFDHWLYSPHTGEKLPKDD
jgi:hypothetical protein